MRFTIITPSFNQLDHLRRCVASVGDQVAGKEALGSEGGQEEIQPRRLVSKAQSPEPNASISVHHHVQDGGSTDGTVDWLRQYDAEIRRQRSGDIASTNYTLTFASEADEGMYEAINKGVAFALKPLKTGKTPGDFNALNEQYPSTILTPDNSVVAWLNCDEQYLPHTLQKVAAFFASNPEVDLLSGGMLVVDEAGELLSCRKAMPMRKLFLEASYLYNYSCAMFFRESFWQKLGGFDTSFKNAGDEDLIRRAVRLGVKSGVLNEYLSTFTYGKTNLSSDPASVLEHERLKGSMGKPARFLVNLARLAEKILRGGHVQRAPVEYAIHTKEEGDRIQFRGENPSCSWPGESKPYLVKHRLG